MLPLQRFKTLVDVFQVIALAFFVDTKAERESIFKESHGKGTG
ncbi:hypothetical protein RCA_02305 [Rickettsia canadensis str. CA410]|uniref:Uncharacterized protein n=1 Tax=Rickettsia canadensis str. CA410 TaxID=1105107 RepID=A0ABN4AAS3_RICCA|nr:hypothetical protein RCA_02305 [Rickettsia canadensis str. CA410]